MESFPRQTLDALVLNRNRGDIMNINMNIKQMADEDNLECVFYFLINDARKDRGIKDEAGKRIANISCLS